MTGSPARLPSARTVLTTAATTTAAGCVIALVGPHAPPADAVLHSWFFYVLYYTGIAASVVVMADRARRPGPARIPWVFLTLGCLSWLLGDLLWFYLVAGVEPAPAASVADVGYLLLFPLTYVGVLWLVRQHTGRLPMATWLDSVIAGLGCGALTGTFLHDHVINPSDQLSWTTLAYPLGDLTLVAVLVTALAVLRGRARGHWWLLLAGFATLAVTDTLYLVEVSQDAHQHPSLTDMGWPVAFLVVALAAHTQPPVVEPDPQRRTAQPGRGMTSAVPLASAAGSLVVLLEEGGNWLSLNGWLAAACISIALVRLALTIRESERLADSHRLALTDELTGLPNWRCFYDEAGKLADPSSGGPGQRAVLMLDLDRFKEVNDSLGHLMGDELLRLVGPRLAAGMAPGDTLARLGGDEFGVVLAGHDPAPPTEVAERLCRSLDEPFDLDGVMVQVAVSVGIALAPEHGTDPTELLQRADVAMYAAKRRRTDWSTYVAEEDPHSVDRLRTVERLRTMLRGDGAELELHYQPKLRLSDGSLAGVEALVRWRHPERGLLFPASFLDLVEESGLARLLTDHVVDQALRQAATWRAAGLDVPVAVNLSATTVIDAELPQMVRSRLEEHGLPPSSLELEITEAFLMSDWVRARGVLEEIRRIGVLISVDDFGTGYSSLSYLRDLPIDQLKLDRTFISRMQGDPTAAALVRSTVSLAHSLGLEMVAEGVESAWVLDQLASFACDQAQGYHIGKPMPAREIDQWVAARSEQPTRPVAVDSAV